MATQYPLAAIGHVRTSYALREATPVQSSLNRQAIGTLELDPAYVAGLDGLAEFDYLWLLTWLGEAHDSTAAPHSLTQVPFLLTKIGRAMGIFATRGPRRVNPIGLSLVQLLAVDGPTIRFAGVDLVDGTPVVDVKPYVTAFDRPPGQPRCGWFDTVELSEGATPADLA